MLARLGDRLGAGLPGIQHRPVQGPTASTGANHQTTIGHRLGQGAHDAQVGQYIDSPRRHGGCPTVGRFNRIDQYQIMDAHGLHGASRRADIARMGGIDQNNANII